ncbi:ARM repeat-containing protein [Mycena rosella]|uniref:Nucleolar protein 9 n=1 Tax=Mycena rosella TaxID=1033263 RepID=A0AAD7G738_MYCRO|nr:ARM repeat-containing protein [Mycena rosella]
MPKEHRKRGKKKKPEPEWQPPVQELQPEPLPQESAGPSWIVPGPNHPEDDVNPEAPFGYVDVDVKAYFRTVDVQIRDWQDNAAEAGTNEDSDPNEERRMFFVAALTEMVGKEKQLATDPDCSLILERMSYSMDDFVRRVFVDSLIGSYDVLVKHRFASHVCQTLFTVANQTVAREKRGIFPTVSESSEKGELRTLTQLIVDVCEELFPVFAPLIMDPFASHVIRALLLLLSPSSVPSHETAQNAMRSKKSAAWKAKQGSLKSVFKEGESKGDPAINVPPGVFTEAARKFVQVVRSELDENETRALAADKVASPTLQMLLAVEADQQMTEDADSLMDRVLVGLISSSREDPTGTPPVSDYLNTLLRDPTSSHLLETVVARCPEPAFCILWATYLKGNLPRIAAHPVANFVLAKALERVNAAQLAEACAELQNVWGKLIQTSRTGVLRAAIDRAATLNACGAEITEAIFAAFQTMTPEERNVLVPCVLRLQTYQELQAAMKAADNIPAEAGKAHPRRDSSEHEPKVQGAVLLQSLLRLSEPHNQLVIASLNSMSIDEILLMAHHAISSRVLDALLDSVTVHTKVKRQFVLSFIGSYHLLVDDRIGSRVGDRCWAFSDTYLKEKIARSLINQEQFLAGSYYGKYFARNLNLYLLQRRPEEWRTMQSERNRPEQPKVSAAPTTQPADAIPGKERKKRKRNTEGNEIEELFSGAMGKKMKRAALVDTTTAEPKSSALPSGKDTSLDDGLADVMGAIRAAPGEGKGHGKRKGGRSS